MSFTVHVCIKLVYLGKSKLYIYIVNTGWKIYFHNYTPYSTIYNTSMDSRQNLSRMKLKQNKTTDKTKLKTNWQKLKFKQTTHQL